MPMKDERPSKRHAEHPSTTVIHHYEERQTILFRWFNRALEKGTKFWALVGAAVVVGLVLVVLLNGVFVGDSKSSQAWEELSQARSSEQQVKIAEEYPLTPAARWARLQAATMVYNQGFDLLVTNRSEAEPLFKRAYKLFSEAYDEAAKTDPAVARLAALGMARTLEASNDINPAIEQYDLVAKTWPNTEEGKQASQLAKKLRQKDVAQFYAWLANYKPAEVTLPPRGSSTTELPNPLGPLPEPTAGASTTSPPGSAPPGSTALPSNLFEPLVPPPPAPAVPGANPDVIKPPAETPSSAPKDEPPKF